MGKKRKPQQLGGPEPHELRVHQDLAPVCTHAERADTVLDILLHCRLCDGINRVCKPPGKRTAADPGRAHLDDLSVPYHDPAPANGFDDMLIFVWHPVLHGICSVQGKKSVGPLYLLLHAGNATIATSTDPIATTGASGVSVGGGPVVSGVVAVVTAVAVGRVV